MSKAKFCSIKLYTHYWVFKGNPLYSLLNKPAYINDISLGSPMKLLYLLVYLLSDFLLFFSSHQWVRNPCQIKRKKNGGWLIFLILCADPLMMPGPNLAHAHKHFMRSGAVC